MSLFQVFTGEVISIEEYAPDITAAYDTYAVPSGCAKIDNGALQNGHYDNLKLVTVKMGRARLASFVANPDLMELTAGDGLDKDDREDQDESSKEDGEKEEVEYIPPTTVRMVYVGAKLAGVCNPKTRLYCYYQDPLTKKFITPKVYFGLKSAIISLVAGYILSLLAYHQQQDMAQVLFEGLTGFCLVSSLIYAAYISTTSMECHQKMRLYLKKVV